MSTSVGDRPSTRAGPRDSGRSRCGLISVGCGLCRVQVDASGFPVDATVVHVVNGQHVKQQQFFVRVGNGTKGIEGEERQKLIAARWPGPGERASAT